MTTPTSPVILRSVSALFEDGASVALRAFRTLSPLIVALSLLPVVQKLPWVTSDAIRHVAIVMCAIVIQCALTLYLVFVSIQVVVAEWRGTSLSLADAAFSLNGMLVLRYIGLTLWMIVVSFLLLLLLIIPGVVYIGNRFFAPYILIVEGESVFTSLRKSKSLMTSAPWYSLSGPLMRLSVILAAFFFVGILVFFVNFTLAASVYFVSGEGGALLEGLIAFISHILGLYATAVCAGFYIDTKARAETGRR